MSKSPFKFERLEPTIFAPPVVNRPPKRLTPRRGDEFTPHGTDSIGVVVSDPRRNKKTVQFRYRHDMDTLHSLPAHEFTDRFARLRPAKVGEVSIRIVASAQKFAAAVDALANALRPATKEAA